MRITTQTLLRVAEETVKNTVKKDHTVLAAFLHGSLNSPKEPMLGGTADIDLVFLHQVRPESPRRFQRLNDDIHLDISHLEREKFRRPRTLRTHPWYGPMIYDFKIMHDPSHFLDFAQASVRDRFYSPGNVLVRANAFLDEARQGWSELMTGAAGDGPEPAGIYLNALAVGAQAFATLQRAPLAERRLMPEFYDLTEQAGQTDFYRSLVELMGGAEINQQDLVGWLPAWEEAFLKASENADPESGIHAERLLYYKRALEEQLASGRPSDLLWLLLHSWTQAVQSLEGQPGITTEWEGVFERLSLLGSGLGDRLVGLDQFLDSIEEQLEIWGTAQGVGAFE